MEREKMIEEMEKDLTDKLFKGGVRQLAEDLVMLNYRKVPEGAVVLTKEEYERLASYISEERAREIFHEETEKLKDAIRKKTKREIVQKLKGFRFVMYDEFDDGHEVASWTCDEDNVKRFAKEIGAE